jgi:hypothetical protein
MLDALLASEELPEEYRDRCQVKQTVPTACIPDALSPYLHSWKVITFGMLQDILCNDCDKKGTAPFHWLYHKCGCCGSYNTKVIRVDSRPLLCLTSDNWDGISYGFICVVYSFLLRTTTTMYTRLCKFSFFSFSHPWKIMEALLHCGGGLRCRTTFVLPVLLYMQWGVGCWGHELVLV